MAGIYTTQDIFLTDDGDFQTTADGDLRYADSDEDVRQEAVVCLYTPVGEFGAFPTLGSTLVGFIGEPNSRANAGLISQEIYRALTQFAGFDEEDITAAVIPTSIDSVLLNIAIQNVTGTGSQNLSIDFNYIAGPTIISS